MSRRGWLMPMFRVVSSLCLRNFKGISFQTHAVFNHNVYPLLPLKQMPDVMSTKSTRSA
jgi:hypothetical protein